jgi:hypothetical protein
MRGVLVLSGVLIAAPAFAYEAVPVMSYAKPTANGKYVLVMLHPFEGARKELKEKYGRSGLYSADDPTKPIWTCDWAADREYKVFASNDGVFAVRTPDGDPGYRHWRLMDEERPIPPKPAGWENTPALHIYKAGKLFRTLAVKDLFDTSRFTDRDCFMGPTVAIESFDDSTGRVVVSTEVKEQKVTATVAFRSGEVSERGGRGGSPSAVIGGDDPPGTGGESASDRNWGRGLLIGLAVVGVCAAAFVGAAVLLLRRGGRESA